MDCWFCIFTVSPVCISEAQNKTSDYPGGKGGLDRHIFLHFLFIFPFYKKKNYKIKFFGQNKSILCDIETVNNTFNKPTDGGAGRDTADREGRPTSMVCIYSRKRKNAAPSMMERVQCNQLTTRWLAGPPGQCCHIGSLALVSAVDMLTSWALHTVAARSVLVRETLC